MYLYGYGYALHITLNDETHACKGIHDTIGKLTINLYSRQHIFPVGAIMHNTPHH